MEAIIKNKLFQATILVLVVLAVFAGTIRNGFIWDDDEYISQNPLLTSPGGLAKIWKNYHSPKFNPEQNTPQYYPLVFTTFYLEHKLWGFNPAGYHIVNLLLHAANTILLLFVLRKLGLNWYVSLITAALFGIHPTQAESVAWATERKNVLAGLFYFGAFLSFLCYQDNSKLRYYIASLVFFVCALLSKTATVGLPVTLILAAYLRERPIRKTIILTIPFFVFSVVAGMVTSILEHTMVGASGAEWIFPPGQRILIASRTLWFYIGKILWPYPLSSIYSRWEINPHSITAYLPLVGVIVVAMTVYILRNKLGRLPVFALLYFFVSAAPVLGFISFFMMRFTFAADHLIYLASWSIMLLLVTVVSWAIENLVQKNLRAAAAVIAALLVLICCAYQTVSQVKKYKDVQTFWEDTIRTNPRAWLAYNNLGTVYAGLGRSIEAIDLLKQAIRIKPDLVDAYNNLGAAYNQVGNFPEAINALRQAIRFNPNSVEAYNNLGAAYDKLGCFTDAIEAYQQAIKIKPDYAPVYNNLGVIYDKLGRSNEAIRSFQQAVTIRPDYVDAYDNLGITFDKLGRYQDGLQAYVQIAKIIPKDPEAHFNLGVAYLNIGNKNSAINEYRILEKLDTQKAKELLDLIAK